MTMPICRGPLYETNAVAGAQAAAVGALATLILVLRSQVSLDFIYFQF
jgi:hypothetical protein